MIRRAPLQIRQTSTLASQTLRSRSAHLIQRGLQQDDRSSSATNTNEGIAARSLGERPRSERPPKGVPAPAPERDALMGLECQPCMKVEAILLGGVVRTTLTLMRH